MGLRLLAFVMFLYPVSTLQVLADTLMLDDDFKTTSLAPYISYVKDVTKDRQLNTYSQLTTLNWVRNNSTTFSKGFSRDNWWIKVDIAKNALNNTTYLLEIAHPVIDSIDVYLVEHSTKSITLQNRLGDKFPFETRPIGYVNFLVPLEFHGQLSYSILMNVKSKNAVQLPLTLWNPVEFHEYNQLHSLLFGVIWGALFIMLFYNLIIYVQTKQVSFLYYTLYVFSILMFLMSLKGYSFQYLWPNAITWNDRAISISLSAALFFAALFAQDFLSIKERKLQVVIILPIIYLLSLISIALSFMLSFHASIYFAVIIATLGCFTGLIVGIYLWSKNIRLAKYYTLSWLPLLVGGIILTLSNLLIIPSNMLTKNVVFIGSVLEVFLLSLSLGEKLNEEKKRRIEAEQKALKIKEKQSEELNLMVKMRTTQLQQANKKLKVISETDALTGLFNRRYLDEQLSNIFLYGISEQITIAIIMLDIDHFKSFNDTHGHQAGDECLKHVAELLKGKSKKHEIISGRLGGEEFALLLSGVNDDSAYKIAQEIVTSLASSDFLYNESKLPVTISAGVALLIPENVNQVPLLLSQADEALYKAKSNGRNRVESFQSPRKREKGNI
jgi:diguanylate cyclase